MLAALLLNLGQAPAPPAPVVAPARFGGGPFWRRYGYDKSYDEIRESTTSALPELVRDVPVLVAPIKLVSKPLILDELRIRNAARKAYIEPEDDEFMQVLLLLGD